MGGDAVFKLFATLGLDTSEYDESLDNSEKKGSSFGTSLKKGLGVAAGVATTAIVATTAATVAGTKAFIDGVSSLAQYGDNIDKMSQKMNMSTQSYQEWDFVMQHCGTSIESMQASIKTLSNAAENNNEAFQKLGITQEEIASMSGEELFNATISALQDVEDETERTYLAGQLLGRGATELGALLNMTAEDTAEMKKQAHELGGVLSDEAVKNSARFQDSLQNMQTAFNGLKRSMLSNFLPSFSTVMDGLSLIFSGDSKSGLGLVKNGIKELSSKITELVPTIVEVGSTIVEALASAITENLPVFIESGLNAVGKFIDGIIDNVDMIITAVEKIIDTFTTKLLDPERATKLVQASIDIIAKLANGISEALPVLIPAIVDVINAIVLTLTEPNNLTLLIQCALQLVIALANGIVEALPELVSVIPTVTMNLIEALFDNAPKILETVLYLLGALGYALLKSLGELLGQTLWEITNAFTKMISKAKDFGTNIGNWLRNGKNNITNGVKNFFTNIGNFFTNGINTIKSRVSSGLENVKNKFTTIFENAKNIVKNALDYIKNLFNFQWSLPKLKLPHFTVTGKLDLLAVPPQIPSVSVEWYKKAMNQPYLLSGATIFGASGGKLLGGGESGSEMVIGTNKLMKMMKEAVGAGNRPININVYGAQGQDIRALAKEVGNVLQDVINDKEKVYA